MPTLRDMRKMGAACSERKLKKPNMQEVAGTFSLNPGKDLWWTGFEATLVLPRGQRIHAQPPLLHLPSSTRVT